MTAGRRELKADLNDGLTTETMLQPMKQQLSILGITALLTCGAGAQVYINEVLPNTPGSDTGNEHFELRGTPGLT